MSFTVTEFYDLTRLLYEHPEWRADLRRLVLSDELLELPNLVQQLAEEQRAFAQEQRAFAEQQRAFAEQQRALGEQQRALGEQQRALGGAQRRSEERLDRIEAILERAAEERRAFAEQQRGFAEQQRGFAEQQRVLAEAQQRTEKRVQELTDAQRGLGIAVGQLQNAFGATIEDEAESMLQAILEEKGYRLLAEPFSLAMDGEVDVVIPLEAPDGEQVWAVTEAKARLSRRQVRKWGQRIKSKGWQQRLAAHDVPGPYLAYMYGIRIYRGVVEEAEKQSVGLLSGRGERVPPGELIRYKTK